MKLSHSHVWLLSVLLSILCAHGVDSSSCAASYEETQQQRRGLFDFGMWIFSRTSVSNCGECATLCDDSSACLEYLCSESDKECIVNEFWFSVTEISSIDDNDLLCTKTCADGYVAEQADVPGWGSINGNGGGEYVSDCGECADMCNAELSCRSYECSPSDRKCNLNSASAPTADAYQDFMFCSKACSNGYASQNGDIPGWGTLAGHGGGESVSDCAECASKCDEVSSCLSYECSTSDLKCNLNAILSPTLDSHDDYVFCSKVCSEGYSEQIGDIPGWGRINSNGGGQSVSDCGDCAGLCDAESTCFSYECSATELKCNLNTALNPTESGYKDYKFCSKDEDECKEGTHNCAGSAECANSIGSFSCTCMSDSYYVDPPGTGVTDGTQCDLDECAAGTHDCAIECFNVDGGYTCCDAGYEVFSGDWDVDYSAHSYSSVWDDNAVGSNHGKGRLNSNKAWCAGGSDGSPWMELDMGALVVVEGVITMTRADMGGSQYVKKFKVSVSEDGSSWSQVEGGSGQTFTGHTAGDPDEELIHLFADSHIVRYIRIYPKTWEGGLGPCMRAGLKVSERCDLAEA